jgi:hemerythrin-like domain-containing protein
MDRRIWLFSLAAAGAGLGVAGHLAAEEEEEIAPAEDLMREHGVLKRVLLVYDDVRERIQTRRDFPPEAVGKAAGIIRSFIEDYHERLEEEHLFPRFRRQGKLVDLVETLEAQHQAGRRLTDRVTALAGAGVRKDAERAELADALRQFGRMYAPHEAREDTVLFPAFRGIVSKHEYAALGEDFEKKEHQLFGKEGFEGMVERVGKIEKSLGIYELAQFTPRSA